MKKKQTEEWLRRLCLAMGGPRFPSTQLRPGQTSDDVAQFVPLLEEYLGAGGDINASTSFETYFGRDIELYDWSLLTAACSVWVNAPKCMQALLDRGANPRHVDSSGRSVLQECISTARHGHEEPLNLIKALPSITSRDVADAQVNDVTEALITELRRGKMMVTSSQTREHFLRVRQEGFTLHKLRYDPTMLNQVFGMMMIVPLTRLASHGRLPMTSEGLHMPLDRLKDNDKARVLFMSHRWLSPASGHPDDGNGTKYQHVLQASRRWCTDRGVSEEDCYIWIDYSCIDQGNAHVMTCAIQSLPFFVLLSDAFVIIDHKEYTKLAWCRLESLFGAAMMVKTKDFGFHLFSPSKGLSSPNPKQFIKNQPAQGRVTKPSDLEFIRALSWFANKLHRWV